MSFFSCLRIILFPNLWQKQRIMACDNEILNTIFLFLIFQFHVFSKNLIYTEASLYSSCVLHQLSVYIPRSGSRCLPCPLASDFCVHKLSGKTEIIVVYCLSRKLFHRIYLCALSLNNLEATVNLTNTQKTKTFSLQTWMYRKITPVYESCRMIDPCQG